MNIYLIVIIAIMVGRFVVELIADLLNLGSISEKIPQEFENWYDNEKYSKSQRYLRETTRFGIFSDIVSSSAMLIFIIFGGFSYVDGLARSISGSEDGEIVNGLLFMAILMFGSQIISLPFSIYSTFVIEERYGFNRTTVRTYVLDMIKGILLAIILGGPILALILFMFDKAGSAAWLWCWGAVTAIQIFMMFVAPYVIMPMFNKFTPLEDGELRKTVEDYAKDQNFAMRGIFTMDGSKRSSKSNAFFTGFGSTRRIVLFDTLIKAHPVPELLAIIAHEMGHYKLRHILKAIVQSIVVMGITFFLMSLCIGNKNLFAAFGMEEHISIYAALVFFGFLYTPVSMVLGIIGNMISRKHEYEADAFAVATTKDRVSMVDGLKRLTVENLGNLMPHKFKVFLDYSHPPVLDRIKAIKFDS
jgi:STE24 endopeptidase